MHSSTKQICPSAGPAEVDNPIGQVIQGALVESTARQEPVLYPFDSGSLLYYPLTERLLVLNRSGTLVLELLSEGYGHGEIASVFAEHFGVSAERAFSDVGHVLADLNDANVNNGRRSEAVDTGPAALGRVVNGLALDDQTRLDDCGVFCFGANRVRVISSVPDVAGLFLRFQHRTASAGDAADTLIVCAIGSSYELIFRNRLIEEPTISRVLARIAQLLLKLEHPDAALLAYCHAAAVCRGSRSILMPGSSGAGKSTLTAFLVANGFTYLGDDIVGIGGSNWALLPLPSCLSIKSGSWAVLDELYPVLGQLEPVERYGRAMRYVEPQGNYDAAVSAVAPSVIVFPGYRAGEETRLSALPPLQTMIRLVGAHATLMDSASEEKLAGLIRFVENTPAYELTYSELPGAMQAIDGLLAGQH